MLSVSVVSELKESFKTSEICRVDFKQIHPLNKGLLFGTEVQERSWDFLDEKLQKKCQTT